MTDASHKKSADKEMIGAARAMRAHAGIPNYKTWAQSKGIRPEILDYFEKNGETSNEKDAARVLRLYLGLLQPVDPDAQPTRQEFLDAAANLPKPVDPVVFGQALRHLLLEDGKIEETHIPLPAVLSLGLSNTSELLRIFRGGNTTAFVLNRTVKNYNQGEFDSQQALLEAAIAKGFDPDKATELAAAMPTSRERLDAPRRVTPRDENNQVSFLFTGSQGGNSR